LAGTDAPLVATNVLIVDGCVFGVDRSEPDTSTSMRGIVYVAEPRSVVSHGSSTAHASRCAFSSTAPVVT
jgi:hypothetical protein